MGERYVGKIRKDSNKKKRGRHGEGLRLRESVGLVRRLDFMDDEYCFPFYFSSFYKNL